MTALDAFNLTPQEWDEVEVGYERAYDAATQASKRELDVATNLLALLIEGMDREQQKALALGILVGRTSR